MYTYEVTVKVTSPVEIYAGDYVQEALVDAPSPGDGIEMVVDGEREEIEHVPDDKEPCSMCDKPAEFTCDDCGTTWCKEHLPPDCDFAVDNPEEILCPGCQWHRQCERMSSEYKEATE